MYYTEPVKSSGITHLLLFFYDAVKYVAEKSKYTPVLVKLDASQEVQSELFFVI